MYYENILKNGKIIYPQNNFNIVCDRCFRSNLTACITFEDKDLCLICVEKLTQKKISPNNDILVRMNSDIYIINDNIKTFDINLKCIHYDKCIHEVFINNNLFLIDGLTIRRKYWDYLKSHERQHFINFMN